jgi:hypothetical protein
MISRTRCPDARVIDWEAVQRRDPAVPPLNPGILSVTTLREQSYHNDNLLNIKHHPAVPLSLIGRIFGVSKGTIKA